MLRAEFDHMLREAQVGNDAAFVRLWRDANPMLTRYLRVAGVSDPRESARHAWAGVIRDLSSFSGDELAWRAWVLGLARDRVDEGAARGGRGSGTHRFSRVGGHRGGGDDGSAVGQVEPAELRGVNETIAAIRDLPLGQGEILMLRLVGELPVARVADLVGTDVVAVRRSEDRAVERLGAERELLAWSLAAPALPEEMADQRIALTAFRERTASSPVAGSDRVLSDRVLSDRVLAVLPGPHTGRTTTGNPTIANPTTANPRTGAPQAVHPRTGKPPTVVRSRTAMLCIAAISASAMSAGALSAAAYVGVLPQGLQQVMHNAIGAPAATETTGPGASPSGQTSSGGAASATAPTMGARPTLPQASSRRSGAGTPPPRDTATHRPPSAKTSPAKSPSGKTPSGKSSAVRPAPSKPAPSNPSATKPKSTSSLSRTSPSAMPTAGVTAPAKGQATSASPAKPNATQRVSPATAHAAGQATVTGATGSARP